MFYLWYVVCIHKNFYNLLKKNNYNVKDVTIIDKNNICTEDIINCFNRNINARNQFMRF